MLQSIVSCSDNNGVIGSKKNNISAKSGCYGVGFEGTNVGGTDNQNGV